MVEIDQYTMAMMCQGARLMSMPSGKEHVLEAYFHKIIRDNGPEFLLEKLTELETHTNLRLQDRTYVMPRDQLSHGYTAPLAWSRKYDQPKGPLSVIYTTWTHPKTRMRGIKGLKNFIRLKTYSPKQLEKFLDGINTDGSYADDKVLYVTRNEAKTFVKVLNQQLHHQRFYSGLDLTGTLLPIGNISVSIKQAKKDLLSSDPETRHDAYAKLGHAYDAQWKSAPRQVTNYIRANFDSFHGVKVSKKTGEIARTYEYDANLRAYGRTSLDSQYAGTVSFLQKPGGKLRSVYNTNRVINYAFTPLAKGIEHAFYDAHPKNIFVKRQDKGMEAIQSLERRHHQLTSADLSSATDRLNFRAFINGLRSAIILNRFYEDHYKSLARKPVGYRKRNAGLSPYMKGLASEYSTKSKWKSLENFAFSAGNGFDADEMRALESLDLFEDVATLPFYSKDLSSAVALRTGQPLGMMGSFQVLTAMNYCMGREAQMKMIGTHDDHIPYFTVVGDDFVGDSRIMKEYHNIVDTLNGKDNIEKALSSDQVAEFCSHLIYRNQVIAIKPKFLAGHKTLWLNAEKTSVQKIEHVYRLDDEDKNALEVLASIGDPALDEMGSIATSEKKPKEERLAINAALEEIGLESNPVHDPIVVDDETEYLSRQESDIDSTYEGTMEDFRSYYIGPDGKKYNIHYTAPVSHYNHSNEFSPDITRYDHHSGERKVKTSVAKAAAQKRRQAYLAKDLVDDYEHGKVKEYPIPYHKYSKVSTTEALARGIDALEKGPDPSNRHYAAEAKNHLVSRQPIPDASRDNELNNSVDMSRRVRKAAISPDYVDMTIKARSHSGSHDVDNHHQSNQHKEDSSLADMYWSQHSSNKSEDSAISQTDPKERSDKDHDSPTM